MSARPTKIFVLDGIGGVPLGRDLCQAFSAAGITSVHFDCLQQQPRPFYAIRSACAKLENKRRDHDGYYHFPRLAEKNLEELVAREQPSHILVVGFAYKFYRPSFLKGLASGLGIPLFLYDTDSCNLYAKRREFIFFVEDELPVYDRVFSFSQVTTRFFRDTRRIDAVHLPFGARPIDPPRCAEQSIDALFVGSCDLRRILLLEKIKAHVSVYGARWQRNGALISSELRERIVDRPVWGDDLQQLLARAKIVLNITRTDFFGAETGINLRLFETLAAGRFLLTDYCEEIEDLFEVGREIEVFRSSGELVDKVRYYLENDDKRQAIAQRGHEKFLESHSWRNRVEQLLGQMNSLPNRPPLKRQDAAAT
jgi:spore maturation protein CgeB